MKPEVLVVDDSLTVRMDLGEAFEAADFTTTLVASAEEARRALAERRFDLVVLDVVLPDADGIDVLREIKEAPGGEAPAVMLLSGEADVAARLRGLRTGADAYVGKPYDRSYVIARGRALVRKGPGVAAVHTRPILVIDDSLTFRETLKETLQHAGYAVVTAASGEEGLLTAVHLRPAALVVDGQMPGIDGPTVVRRIRSDALLRRTPCILLTASDDDHVTSELRALEAGADFYVRKESDPSVVLARLSTILRASQDAPVEVGRAPAEATSSLLGPKKVLVVDDSPTYLDEIGRELRQGGYEVVQARSGEEALELLGAEPVDCILLDVMMPGMDGHAACRIIKTTPAWRDIPLILHTARDERGTMIEGINAGADDFVAKSNDFDLLRARLRAQLRRRQFEDENRSIREQLLAKEMEAAEMRSARALAESRAELLGELRAANTELLRAKRDLEQQNQHVMEANRLKSEFLANMSHELRTPLNAIIGFSELIAAGRVLPDSPRFQEYVGHIVSSGHHLLQLINDVLDLAKVEAGKLEFAPELIHFAQVVTQAVAVLGSQASQHRVTVVTELEEQVGLVRLDPARLKQIVYNYLANAIKFTPEGGRVVVRAALDEGDLVRLEVEDTGIGIAAADLSRLFVEFQQLDAGADKKYGGTGLGLAFTKRIVEAQGGRVGVRSTPGAGSTFWAVLPRGNTRGDV